MTGLVAAALLGAAAPPMAGAQAAGDPVDKAKLRQAAAFPVITLQPSMTFTAQGGYRSSSDMRDLPAEIAALQKTLAARPDDAEGRSRLGRLFQDTGDPVRAKEAHRQAAALYRLQAAARPGDGKTLAALGASLAAAGQTVEAEAALRRAVRAAPGRPETWTALAEFLSYQAGAALLPPSFREEGTDFAFVFGPGPSAMAETARAFVAKYGQTKPAAAQIAQAQALLDEARACYDRAVAAQPRSADAYVARAGFRGSIGPAVQAMIAALQPAGSVDIATAKESGDKAMAGAWGSAPALSDLQEAARLAPDSLTDVGLSAMIATMALKLGGQGAQDVGRRSAEEALRPLEALAQNAGTAKNTAAQASEAAGLLHLFAGSETAAEPLLRRAVALDPRRESAWDGLTMILVSAQNYGAAALVLEARLKVLDTARGHLLLAKVYDKLGQTEKETAQVQAALSADPGDLTANIAQAALLLRRSDDAATLDQANQQLFKIDALYRRAMPQTQQSWEDQTLLVSIYHALTGDAASAREKLTQILHLDKDYAPAKQALAALGVESPKTT